MSWHHQHEQDGPWCEKVCKSDSTWPPREKPPYEGDPDWYRRRLGLLPPLEEEDDSLDWSPDLEDDE